MKTQDLAAELGCDIRLQSGQGPTDPVLITVADSLGSRSLLLRDGLVRVVNAADYLADPLAGGADDLEDEEPLRPAVVALYWAAIVALVSLVLLSLSGMLQLRVVLTGSMSPHINAGDVVVGIAPQWRTPQVGDVVVYTARRFDGSAVATFAHRIVGGVAATGYVLKGDANPEPDVGRPMPEDISAVVVFRIPLLGNLLDPRNLSLLLLTVVSLWLIISGVQSGRRR